MSDDSVQFEIEPVVNAAAAVRAGDQLGDLVGRGVDRSGLGDRIRGTIDRSVRQATRSSLRGLGDAFDPLNSAARLTADTIGRVGTAIGDVGEQAATLGTSTQRSFGTLEDRVERINKSTAALNERVAATRRTFSQIGADPGLFAVIDDTLDDVNRRVRIFNADLERIADDPNLLDGYEIAFKNAQATIFREIAGGIQPALRALTTAQRIEGNRVNEVASRQQQERLQDARLANSRRIVAEQGANAQLLAETRLAGQKQIQDERIRARSRVELIRLTFQQIRILERGIAGVFRATGTIANSAFRTLGSAVDRVGGLFRRSNRDLNEGLNGALIRREQSIDRSFRRQTSDIRRQTLEQSRIIQRFEAQASTGVAGALSGRSSLGALFGGGLAFGGGFAAFQGLRNGLDVGGDFVQGLAVLGAQLELTEEQMAGVRQQSIELGNDITLPGVSALDAAQAIQILGKQFANLGDTALPAAQKAAKGVLQLSRAAGVSAEEAARVVGAAVNVFRINADNAVAVADQVTNALTKSAGVAFGDFADAFTQSAGVVRLFTGDAASSERVLAEFNAAIAVLAKNGLIGSDAGTSLKQFFLQANRGTVEAQKVLDRIVESAGASGSVFFDAAGGARTLAESLDILRRGTADLSNQDLTKSLGKLFGSDAARAAAFLIDTTATEFEGLTDSILQQGAAAKIAEAQNTGLRGALDALGSVIETQQIKTYERFQGVLGKVVLRFADMLNAFFEGRGRLGLLRDALVGAAAALSALLVAKLVGEAFQFMAIGLRAALTPLGALVVTTAALGAAVNVLADRSPEFRDALLDLGDTIVEVFGPLIGRALRGLERLATLAGDVVVPQIERLATFIATTLDEAIRDAFNFITGTAIPALSTFADFVSDRLLPPLERLGSILVDKVLVGLDRARDAAVDLFDRVEPLVEPAITAFDRLGDAVARAFGGGPQRGRSRGQGVADDILPALRGVAVGVAASLVNVGEAIIDALRPQLERVRDFIGGFLSGKGGSAGKSIETFLLGPFQRAAVALGFFIGNLTTDPRLVAALEKLVGLALLTGANFVKGLGKGIGDNMPKLGSMIGKQLAGAIEQGLRAALDPVTLAKFIVSGLGAAIIGTAIFHALRDRVKKSGVATGLAFTKSLSETVRTGFTGARNNPLAAGLLGGVERVESTARNAARRANDAIIREQLRAVRDLNRLNQTIKIGPDDNQFKTATDQLNAYKAKFGEVATTGALLRTQMAEVARGIGLSFRGLREAFGGGLEGGLASTRAALTTVGTSLRDAAVTIRENFRATGIGLGQALGGAIISGVGSALAGQQLGTSDSGFGKTLGLAGIISASLFGAASVGGGVQGVVVGGLIAGLGLVSAQIAKSGEKAREAAGRIDRYTQALRDADSAADAITGSAAIVEDQIATLDGFGLKILELSGFDINAFTESVLGGADALTALDEATPRLDRAGFDEAFKDVKGYSDILAIVTRAEEEILAGRRRAGQFDFFDRNVPDPDAIEGTADAVTHVNDVLAAGQSQMDRYVGGLIAAGEAQDKIKADNLVAIGSAVESLNQQRTDLINNEIGRLTTELDTARQAADTALQAVLDLINNPLDDPFQGNFDQLLLGIESAGGQLAEALRNGVDLNAIGDLGSALGAQLRQIVAPFASSFQQAVAAAVTENPGISADALREKFQPIFDQIASGTIEIPDAEGNVVRVNIPPEAQRVLTDTLNSLLANPALEMGLQNVALTDDAITELQDQLNTLNAQLPVAVRFSATQIQQEIERLGLNVPLGSIMGFLDQAAARESQARARALDDQTFKEQRENPLPPPVVFNQTLNTTINGATAPTQTASELVSSARAAAVNGLITRMQGAR